jgi:hypothetical protein
MRKVRDFQFVDDFLRYRSKPCVHRVRGEDDFAHGYALSTSSTKRGDGSSGMA